MPWRKVKRLWFVVVVVVAVRDKFCAVTLSCKCRFRVGSGGPQLCAVQWNIGSGKACRCLDWKCKTAGY